MSQLEDFFSEPIESEQTMGLEQAFAQEPEPTMGLEQAFTEDSNSTMGLEQAFSNVSVEPEDSEEFSLEDLYSFGQMMEQSADEGIQNIDAMQSVEEVSREEGTEGLKDTGQLLAQGYAGYKATPGPMPIKMLGGAIAATPPAKRVADEVIDGTMETDIYDGIRRGASQLGTELGVNQESNLKENLEARRSALGAAEAIKPMKPRTMGVDTKDLLQSGIF